MALLEDIRTHIVEPKCPLAAILRETMVLAHKLKSDELKAWIKAELEGFPNDAELPSYRKFRAPSVGTGTAAGMRGTNVHIPTDVLPDYMRDHIEDGSVCISVPELESLLGSTDDLFYTPWPEQSLRAFNRSPHRPLTLVAASIVMSRGLLEHVLGSVRTRLLTFVLEIEDLNPDAGEIPSVAKVSPTQIQQIFEKVIMKSEHHGDIHNVVGAQGSNIATGQARISSSHASYTSAADVTTALEDLKNHVSEVTEANRTQVVEAIDLLIAAINDCEISKSRIVAAAEVVANASERMKRALRDLWIGVTGSLAANGIWEGIRYAMSGG